MFFGSSRTDDWLPGYAHFKVSGHHRAQTKKVHRSTQPAKKTKINRSAHTSTEVHFSILSVCKMLKVFFCALLISMFFSVCTSPPGAWVTDPHATFRDNDQGCGHSDAATCLPIPHKCWRPLCRAGHAVYRPLIFSFQLRGAVLQQR